MGLFSATVNLGLIIAPQVSLPLVSSHGPAAPWYVAGGTILVALMVIIGISRNDYVWLVEGRSKSGPQSDHESAEPDLRLTEVPDGRTAPVDD
jgi:hypothetical protein